MIFPPEDMESGGIWGCHNWGWMLVASDGQKPRMLLMTYMHRVAPTAKKYLAPSVNSTEVKKTCGTLGPQSLHL